MLVSIVTRFGCPAGIVFSQIFRARVKLSRAAANDPTPICIVPTLFSREANAGESAGTDFSISANARVEDWSAALISPVRWWILAMMARFMAMLRSLAGESDSLITSACLAYLSASSRFCWPQWELAMPRRLLAIDAWLAFGFFFKSSQDWVWYFKAWSNCCRFSWAMASCVRVAHGSSPFYMSKAEPSFYINKVKNDKTFTCCCTRRPPRLLLINFTCSWIRTASL